MRGRRGLTLAEVVVTLVVVAVAALLVAWLMLRIQKAREEARRMRCRGNLNQLAKGFATYLNEHGDNRFYPYPMGRGTRPDTFNGAEWLAALYWSGVIPDPGVFWCPSTWDTNVNGADIGTFGAAPTFSRGTISYAAMHYRCGEERSAPAGSGHRDWSFDPPWGGPSGYRVATDQSGRPTPGAIRDDYPPNLPTRPRGMCILFFDSHVEFWEEPQIDAATAVGRKAGPLWLLGN